jgi:hypothetical protein
MHQTATAGQPSQSRKAPVACVREAPLLLLLLLQQQHFQVLLLLQRLQVLLLLLHLLLSLQVKAHLLLLLLLHHQLLLQLQCQLLLLCQLILLLVLLRDPHDQLLEQGLLRSIQLVVLLRLRLRLCGLLRRWLLLPRLLQQLSKLQGTNDSEQMQRMLTQIVALGHRRAVAKITVTNTSTLSLPSGRPSADVSFTA